MAVKMKCAKEKKGKQYRWAMQRLIPFSRPYNRMVIIGLTATVLAYSAEAVPPLVFGWIIDDALVNGDLNSLRLFSIVIGLAFLAFSYFDYLGVLWMESWGMKIEHAVRVAAFDKAQHLNMAYFDEHQTGDVISVLSNDINQLEQFVDTNIQNLLQSLIQIVAMTVIMFGINWRLTAILIIPIPIIAYATVRYTGLIKGAYRHIMATLGKINARLADILRNIAVVKGFAREPLEKERIAEVSWEYHDANVSAITLRAVFFPTLNLLSYLAYVTVLLLGGYWVIQGEFTIGALTTFLMYTQRFYQPLSRFGRTVNDFQRAEASCERIFSLMDHPNVESNWHNKPRGEQQTIQGDIRLCDVTLTYPTASEPALVEVSFHVPMGGSLGLVGPTGSGKSTLTKILLNFYQPERGEVLIDGRSIAEYPLRTLRESIGVVAQDTEMFYGTLWENIQYGNPQATKEQIWQAMEVAGVTEFLDRLPNGPHTLIGEKGVKLSGGQRQRVAIARAILKDPRILILDEATSAVDSKTEQRIQQALSELAKDRTTLIVAHRLSTIRDCDQILVFDKSRIVEQGTHEQLLEQGGLYASLWWTQLREEQDKQAEESIAGR